MRNCNITATAGERGKPAMRFNKNTTVFSHFASLMLGISILFLGMTVFANAQSSGVEPSVGIAPDTAPAARRSESIGGLTGRQLKVYVFGDSLGDGMSYGLGLTFKGDDGVKIVRMSRASTGFVRDDFYNWNAALPAILEKEEMDIAVVMIGSNDRQAMRLPGGGEKFGTPKFLKIYTERVDRFMKAFAGRNISVYWLGMPVTRGPKHSAAMKVLNGIYEKRAKANGITFVSTWEEFLGDDGGFTANGPDVSGEIIRIRGGDGVHFTRLGNRKLASLIEGPIRDRIYAGQPTEGEVETATPPTDADTVAGGRKGDVVVVKTLDDLEAASAADEADDGAQDISAGRTREANSTTIGVRSQAGNSQEQSQDASPAYQVLTLGGRVESKPGRGDDFTWKQ